MTEATIFGVGITIALWIVVALSIFAAWWERDR